MLINKLKHFIQLVYVGERLEDLTNNIISLYVDRNEERESEFYINRYNELVSNLIFEAAIVDDILARRQAAWIVYAYVLDYYNDAIWDHVPVKLRGAPHSSEYPYVVGSKFLTHFEFSEKDQLIADFLQKSFAEFVKTGIPLYNNRPWQNVGTEPDIRYTQVTPHPQIKMGFFNDTAAFWQRMCSYGYDMVQLLPTKKNSKYICMA